MKQKFSLINRSTQSQPANDAWLIIFANTLDPDQARQNVRPDLDLNLFYIDNFYLLILESFFKLILKKKSADDKKECKITALTKMNAKLPKGFLRKVVFCTYYIKG